MNPIVTPYGEIGLSKKAQVTQMFNTISTNYDLLNQVLSLGIHHFWRRKAIDLLKPYQPKKILDIATGTGDFAIEAMQLKPNKIIGIDIAEKMIVLAKKKIDSRFHGNDREVIDFQLGDSEKLLFDNNSIDAITIGFGVRNFEDLKLGLSEIHRVLKNKGAVVILEPAAPTAFPLKQLYSFYFKHILPQIGKIVCQDPHAYTYLHNSVNAFPQGNDFLQICQKIGFQKTTFIPLTFGICALYLLEK